MIISTLVGIKAEYRTMFTKLDKRLKSR